MDMTTRASSKGLESLPLRQKTTGVDRNLSFFNEARRLRMKQDFAL